MINLLIVDDEPYVVRWLEELFRYESGLELQIYTADSGLGALEWLSQRRMDVVISDIRMPKMDGISLMKEIGARWPHCKVIFLTGYGEFDYVYEAIDHPGVSYLLKTEDDDVIIGKVREAIHMLKEERRAARTVNRSESILRLVQTQYAVTRYLKQDMRHDDEALLADSFPHYDLARSAFIMMANSRSEGRHAIYRHAIVENVFREMVDDRIDYVARMLNQEHLLFLVQFSETTYSREAMEGILEQVIEQCELQDVALSFIASSEPVAHQKMDRLIRILDAYVQEELLVARGAIRWMTPQKIEEHADCLKQSILKENLNVLEQHLEDGNKEAFHKLLSNVEWDMNRHSTGENFHALEIYSSVALRIMGYANRVALYEHATIRTHLTRLLDPESFTNWQEAFGHLHQLTDAIFQVQKEIQEQQSSHVLKLIHEYVDDHLSGDLSLNALADYMNYNPSYLSRLYKELSGENYQDYVIEKRIQTAAELLRDTNEPIFRVAARVGFENPQYFSRVFRRFYGTSPKKFRECSVLMSKPDVCDQDPETIHEGE